ncbi:hypothetical protein [Amycolatopsis sp. MtRt-6]|uniref:hypothetical protein n=1 Tax=Amycolatopsis sp. MtRt-6 TaxID=2792782 RepID=UPI001F5D7401|nr:hypothetical protein [Amycolatopsis sp. MtRt-6]
MSQRPVPVARLSDLPRRAVERSGRLTEVWRPLGLGHELRVVFRVDGTAWGAAGLVRRGEFGDREVEFLTSVAPALTAATRVGPPAPAVRGSGRTRRSWSSARTAGSGRPPRRRRPGGPSSTRSPRAGSRSWCARW